MNEWEATIEIRGQRESPDDVLEAVKTALEPENIQMVKMTATMYALVLEGKKDRPTPIELARYVRQELGYAYVACHVGWWAQEAEGTRWKEEYKAWGTKQNIE